MKLNLQWDIQELMWLNDKVNAVVQIILVDVWNEITNNAKENAPYLTWSLRKSLNQDFSAISKWFAVVGSPLDYASLREYSNRKNPQTTLPNPCPIHSLFLLLGVLVISSTNWAVSNDSTIPTNATDIE